MIYLDYSATTPVNDEVLNSFNKVVKEYPGNANSLHELGIKSKHLMEASVKQIANLLKVHSEEVIFTSGASEANNLAIIGTILKYKNRNHYIISTKLEHSSVNNTLEYLAKNGYTIDYINILENGKIDLDDLKTKLLKEPVLVSISQVNSELGLIQDVNQIGLIIKNYPKTVFHVDGTQAIGKIPVNLDNIDLYSFSSHKIYGLNGVGCLIKKKNIELEPIIHGGKSQTNYRSGTPTHALYASFAKALKLVLEDFSKKYDYVLNLNNNLRKELETIKEVQINSNQECIPHILNISIKNIKPETLQHALALEDIYISTKTACSKDNKMSESVYELTKDLELAKHSLRISLSYLTSLEEITEFVKVLKIKIEELSFLKGE